MKKESKHKFVSIFFIKPLTKVKLRIKLRIVLKIGGCLCEENHLSKEIESWNF